MSSASKPPPARLLNRTSPSQSAMQRFTIARPKPKPPVVRVRDSSGLKTRVSISWGCYAASCAFWPTAEFGIPPLKIGAELIIEDVDPHVQ
jgi:hypothetical protein